MNDKTFKECGFGADMVPYMYSELSAATSAAFESHLLECSACTDEFASLSLARYEVYDWKTLEFDGLATPTFALPIESESESAGPAWIEKIRAAFSGSWLVPSVSFAALSIVSLFAALFVLSGDNAPEIAANVDRSNSVAESRVADSAPAIAEASSQREANGEVPDVERAVSRPALASVDSAALKRSPRKTGARNAKPASRSYEFTASARNEQKTVPRLNEFTEDEDTSLRLAELFDDLDTRN